MTSLALTNIFFAKSETDKVSGTKTSCTTASVGATNAFSSSSCFCDDLFLPFLERQPLAVGAPRVLKPRLRFSLSFQSLLLLLSFLASLLAPGLAAVAPAFAAGLCNVPSLSFFDFSFAAASSASLRFCSSSIRRCFNASFLRKSSC